MAFLTLSRHEWPRHSAPKAREPATGEQKRTNGSAIRPRLGVVSHTNNVQEFNSLDDDAGIYKLVGPVLLKQDSTEAKSTVDGRLEYIGGEMYDRPHEDCPAES